MQTRQELRQTLRHRRRSLPDTARHALSWQICQHIIRHRRYQRARHVALYLSNDAEVDVTPLIRHAWAQGKQVYLPVLGLRHTGKLWFVPYNPGDVLYWNRFGIAEPAHRNRDRYQPLRQLDLVVMPLVGFDREGHRLGMGGGFYDRSLTHRTQQHHWQRPHCMGAAYSIQEIGPIAVHPWDVALDAIVTEQGIQQFN
jgi:5-formyltetrahydrofolate cyclo-ligase